MPDRSKVNFLIDALMFLCMMTLAGLGLLMKFVLIPGKERWVKYGRNVELLILGKDRHEWGTIHFIIALVLFGVLVVHIILHWKMIVNIYQRLIGSQKSRRVIAMVFLIISVILVVSPFVVQPKLKELGRGQGRIIRSHEEITDGAIGYYESSPKDTHDSRHRRSDSFIEVMGLMTLIEVSERYNVPTEYLKKELDIPHSTSEREKLGWLRKRYGFRMSEVERIIEKYHEAR